MRKLTIPALVVALFALVAWTGGATAGNCAAKKSGNCNVSKTADAGSKNCDPSKCADAKNCDVSKCADAKTAGNSRCGNFKSAGAGSACKTNKTANAGYTCNTNKSTSAAFTCNTNKSANAGYTCNDAFLGSYIDVQKGLLKGCAHSTRKAVDIWTANLEGIVANTEDVERKKHLNVLTESLASWPDKLDDQRAAFAGLSEWIINYCETFPERTQGANVVSCPESGHRWVQTDDLEGNPYSG